MSSTFLQHRSWRLGWLLCMTFSSCQILPKVVVGVISAPYVCFSEEDPPKTGGVFLITQSRDTQSSRIRICLSCTNVWFRELLITDVDCEAVNLRAHYWGGKCGWKALNTWLASSVLTLGYSCPWILWFHLCFNMLKLRESSNPILNYCHKLEMWLEKMMSTFCTPNAVQRIVLPPTSVW